MGDLGDLRDLVVGVVLQLDVEVVAESRIHTAWMLGGIRFAGQFGWKTVAGVSSIYQGWLAAGWLEPLGGG